jgi:hypothetical protein
MIRGMWKRMLATLIIFGCVSLPGLDVVEDLNQVPGQSQLAAVPNEFSPGSQFWQFIDFHDASQQRRTKATKIETITSSPIIFHYVRPAELRKNSLHKLFRVLLI